MADGLTIEFKGGAATRRAIIRFAEKNEAAARQIVKGAAVELTGRVKADSDMPVDTGRLRSSVTQRFENDGLMGFVFTDVQYAQAVHDGTDHSDKAPPSDALQGWARRHGLAGLEFVIAQSIKKRGGLEARPFMENAVQGFDTRFAQIAEAGIKRANSG